MASWPLVVYGIMTSTIKTTPQKEEMLEKEGSEIPLLDLSDAAVKQMIRSAKKRGYVTHDQITALISMEEVKSEQIEDILAKLSELGINVVETKEAEFEEEEATHEEPEEGGENELVEIQQRPLPVKSGPRNPLSAPTTPCACISARWVRWDDRDRIPPRFGDTAAISGVALPANAAAFLEVFRFGDIHCAPLMLAAWLTSSTDRSA